MEEWACSDKDEINSYKNGGSTGVRLFRLDYLTETHSFKSLARTMDINIGKGI